MCQSLYAQGAAARRPQRHTGSSWLKLNSFMSGHVERRTSFKASGTLLPRLSAGKADFAMEEGLPARRPCPAGGGESFAFPVFASKRRKKDFSEEDDPDSVKQPALQHTGIAALDESDITESSSSVAPVQETDNATSARPTVPAAAAGSSASPSPALMRCPVLGCGAALWGVAEYDRHYRSCHQMACHVCRKTLPSARLLSLHVSEAHDSFFQAKLARGVAMYECLVETCEQRFHSDPSRLLHLVDRHGFPDSFRFHGAAASHPSQRQRRKQQQKQHQHSSPAPGHKHSLPRNDQQATANRSILEDDATPSTGAMHQDEDSIISGTSEDPLRECTSSAMSLEGPAARQVVEPEQSTLAEEGRLEEMHLDTNAATTGATRGALGCGNLAAVPGDNEPMAVEAQLSAALSRLSCGTDFVPRQVSFGRRTAKGTMPVRAPIGNKTRGPAGTPLPKPGMA